MTQDIRDQHPSGCRILEFSRDSFLNATLTDAATGETVYTIQTQSGPVHGMRTSLRATQSTGGGVESREVAFITKGAIIHSNKIAFPGRQPLKIKDWIHKRTFTDPDAAKVNGEVIRYTWANVPDSPKAGTISLHAEHSADHPIAWYYPSVAANPPWPAKVVIHPDAFAMQDVVLASLLADEQVDRSTASKGINYGRAAPMMAAVGPGAYSTYKG
ncbi:hypothetical protein BXZ70DRAFT_186660 [Cristinia sonorae]|uniref:DUF6593 domain-containing protein n=1 Tax=Cristinia sonorae TaxID=1940300 RepID=A0A8K0XQ91_9AGAR|nr:hypothetical protein BXZ70DRAFT_186660 [Cristinia sonorae]